MDFEYAVIIRDKTRLEQLIERFNTKAQARFYIDRVEGNFARYEQEHATFYESLQRVEQGLVKQLKVKVLDRSFLSTYIFNKKELIVVVGQDGLVANSAKYVKGLPIIGVNSDPGYNNGALLPYSPYNFHNAMQGLFNDTATTQSVSMAEAEMNDGQRLMAFNDFYIGASSHVSSRYRITHGDRIENQSSSGVLVSTGAGSTGWLSSVFHMTENVNQHFHPGKESKSMKMDWTANHLLFVVREPFRSVNTQVKLGFGRIDAKTPLFIESQMPGNGVVFSDGIEADHLKFDTGSTIRIGLASEKARIVV